MKLRNCEIDKVSKIQISSRRNFEGVSIDQIPLRIESDYGNLIERYKSRIYNNGPSRPGEFVLK